MDNCTGHDFFLRLSERLHFVESLLLYHLQVRFTAPLPQNWLVLAPDPSNHSLSTINMLTNLHLFKLRVLHDLLVILFTGLIDDIQIIKSLDGILLNLLKHRWNICFVLNWQFTKHRLYVEGIEPKFEFWNFPLILTLLFEAKHALKILHIFLGPDLIWLYQSFNQVESFLSSDASDHDATTFYESRCW